MAAGEDPRHYARLVAMMREATLSGARPPCVPRPVIAESWRRMVRLGLDPDHNEHDPVLTSDEVEARRRESGLTEALPVLRDGLMGLAEEAGHIMVVADHEGRVLWRDGSAVVVRKADELGFSEGAGWREESAGTNAVGTTLAVGRPVQVFSAEHYVRTHHNWTCAASPLHSPRDGRLLGVVNISSPATTFHPTTLALVDAVAQLAEAQLRLRHLADLERLRSVALPVISRVEGRAFVTDADGWVAATAGLAPVEKIALPQNITAGRIWLPAYGGCDVEPLPGGWLVRAVDSESRAYVTTVLLDLSKPAFPELTVSGGKINWSHSLTPRHAEILYLLSHYRAGRTARQLAVDLFDDPTRVVTVRAEMSRLRKHLGGIVQTKPYRIAENLDLVVNRPANGDRPLPYSGAPGIRRIPA
ncbi:GAF domain-containing protein [Amycolatopsis pigmentata]|uniref:GAF domain-containing protein n=1 Tax=Amycolatopsis pigmentata TaxID=450801 RepID=A0ABW5G8G2_9PSEU